MKYGFTVTPGDISKNLDYAANYNFNVVEINLPAAVPLEMLFYDQKSSVLNAFAEENLVSYAFNIPFSINISDIIPAVREKGIKYLSECIKFAGKINASYISMHFGKFYWFPFEDVMRRRTLDRFIEFIEPIVELCKDHDIVLALENLYPLTSNDNYYYLGDNIYDFEYLFNNIDSPYLKMCFNTGHANLAEGIEEYIDKLNHKFLNIHLSDNLGAEDEHLAPGAGEINWNTFFEKMLNTNFNGPFVAECLDIPPHEVIKKFELLRVKCDHSVLI